MYIIEKCPDVFFHVEKFVLAATPFFAYRNLLSQLLKVLHTQYGIKMTRIIELVGTQAITKLLSYYLFELSSKNRLSQNSISASEGRR